MNASLCFICFDCRCTGMFPILTAFKTFASDGADEPVDALTAAAGGAPVAAKSGCCSTGSAKPKAGGCCSTGSKPKSGGCCSTTPKSTELPPIMPLPEALKG